MARVLRWLVLCGGVGLLWLGSAVARALRWLGSVWNDLLIKGGWVGSVGDGSCSAVARVLQRLVLCGGSGFAVARALRWLGFCGGSGSAVAYCGAGLWWLGLCGGSAQFAMTSNKGWMGGSVGCGSRSAVARALRWLGLCGG